MENAQENNAKNSDSQVRDNEKKFDAGNGSSGFADSSNDEEGGGSEGRKPAASDARRPNRRLFPRKLWQMIEDASREGNDHIIRWLPDGRSFRVFMPKLFVEIILPRYVQQSNYRSFQRQLYLYNFHRILDEGPSQDSYVHPFFQKDGRQLENMIPQKSKRKTPRRLPKKKQSVGVCGVAINPKSNDDSREIPRSHTDTFPGHAHTSSLSNMNLAGSVPLFCFPESREVLSRTSFSQPNLQEHSNENSRANGRSTGPRSVEGLSSSFERNYTDQTYTLAREGIRNSGSLHQASDENNIIQAGRPVSQTLLGSYVARQSANIRPVFGLEERIDSNSVLSQAQANLGWANPESFVSAGHQQSSQQNVLPENISRANFAAGYSAGFQPHPKNIQVSRMQERMTTKSEENDEDDHSMGSDFSHAVTAAVSNSGDANSILQFPVNARFLQPVDGGVFGSPNSSSSSSSISTING